MMSMSAGTELGRAELVDYVRATVDIIIQLANAEGRRMVSEIYYKGRSDEPAGAQ